MKQKLVLTLIVVVGIFTMTFAANNAFAGPRDGEVFPIWHINQNGSGVFLELNENAAIAHLENHPNDFCHPGHCPSGYLPQ